MSTSGIDTFTVNRDQIINEAAKDAGFLGVGRVLSYDDLSSFQLKLNLIVKQWMGKSDFAPGLKVWSRKRGVLFPQFNQTDYTLGETSTDHATADTYVQTTTTATASPGNTTLTVSSITGLASGMYVGIRMGDTSFYWTTINGTPSGSTVTLTAAIPATATAAASGSTVYAYTNNLNMPLEIISCRRRNTSNAEIPLEPILVQEYENGILNKHLKGTPTRYLYERGLINNGLLKFDYQIQDTTEVYLVTFLRPIQDFNSATDTPDYPQEYFRPLVSQLAVDIATGSNLPVTEDMLRKRDESLKLATNVDPENIVMYFQPDM